MTFLEFDYQNKSIEDKANNNSDDEEEDVNDHKISHIRKINSEPDIPSISGSGLISFFSV